MSEEEQQTIYQSIAAALVQDYPVDCKNMTAERVAELHRWNSGPMPRFSPCDEMAREMLRQNGLIEYPQSGADILHRLQGGL